MPATSHRFVPLWSQSLQAEPCGLSLAREKGWLLAWDQSQWIYLLNQAGRVQAQTRFPGTLASCALADDGSTAVAVGREGEVRWLTPDLTTRWQGNLENPLYAAAVDPFGHFLAAADTRGNVHLLDHAGKTMSRSQSPRPMQHLAFIPTLPLIVGCADYGLVGALDAAGTWRWRKAQVVNVGGLSANADGSEILLASFSDGLHVYGSDGKTKPRRPTPEPCRLIAQSFAGDRSLMAGLTGNVYLLDRDAAVLCRHVLDKRVIGLALSARGDAAWLAHGGGIVKGRIEG